MRKDRHYKCCMCGKRAVWRNNSHEKGESIYFCDDCVRRGDITNIKNLEENGNPILKDGEHLYWWDEGSDINEMVAKSGSYLKKKTSFYYEILDRKYRRKPKDSFEFCEHGFEKLDKGMDRVLQYEDLYDVCADLCEILNIDTNTENELQEDILNIYCIDANFEKGEVNYNLFLSKYGDLFRSKLNNKKMANNARRYKTLNRFYVLFKENMKICAYFI